jgi:hypothetical protein
VPLLMFFNELACPSPQPRDRGMVDEAMVTFARLLRHIARLRTDAAMVSAIQLMDLELAPGYYLAEWAGQPRHRDLFRAIRSGMGCARRRWPPRTYWTACW